MKNLPLLMNITFALFIMPRMNTSLDYIFYHIFFLSFFLGVYFTLILLRFHLELKNFADSFSPLLQNYKNEPQNSEVLQSITIKGSSWFSICIDYLVRCVDLLDEYLDVVIHSILLGKQVSIVASPTIHADLIKLMHIISIVNISSAQAKEEEELEEALVASNADNPNQLRLTVATPPSSPTPSPSSSPSLIPPSIAINSRDSNKFCMYWAQQLRSAPPDAFRLRTILEEMKLKVIQVFVSLLCEFWLVLIFY